MDKHEAKANRSISDADASHCEELMAQMSAINKELRAISDRVSALETQRAANPRAVASSILFVLFALVPVAAIVILIYYMTVAP